MDRGLGGAVDAEPRQADQIRGARWTILSSSPSSSSARGDAAGGLAAVDGSALEPERGRLAVFPRARASCSACATATDTVVATAALLPYTAERCLDQHGAGHRELAAARARDAAGRYLSQHRDEARPHHLARRDARGRDGLWPARLHADASSCGGCGLRMHPARARAPLSAGKLDEFITCDISAMGFDRRDLLQELGGRANSQLVSNGDAMALVRDGRTARHIGPLFADDAGARASIGARHRRERNRPAAHRRRRHADRIPRRPHERRLDHRTAVPAHALWPRHQPGGRTCRSPSPAPNLDRTVPCTTARSNPRCGA